MPQFLKRKLFWIIIVIIGAIVAGAFFFFRGEEEREDIIEVSSRSVVQEISATGRVKPAQSVKLAFERSGRIARVNVSVGDRVVRGRVLTSLQNAELNAQLLQSQAALAIEEAELQGLLRGTRPEEITNAQTVLDNAQTNLTNVKIKADADISQDYQAGLTAADKALDVADGALVTANDLRRSYFSSGSQEGSAILIAVVTAQTLVDTAYASVSLSQNVSGSALVDAAITDTLSALQETQDALSAIPVKISFSAADKSSLSAEKVKISTELSTITSKQEIISVQRVTDANAIATAGASVAVAGNDLTLLLAGATTEQIAAQEASVKAAQATVQQRSAVLGQTILRAPIDGIVTQSDAKVGEIVVANTAIVSLISDVAFEIEAFIAEVDIAKLELNDRANVTLDAYGESTEFFGRVISIDPAETITEGVPSYRVVLQFEQEDGRIKSGMTANIDILTDQRKNVLAVPLRAVITRGGQSFLRVINDAGQENDVIVEVGLRGSDGFVEVISGVVAGTRIIRP